MNYTHGMSKRMVHLNGQLVPAAEAQISVADAAVLHGFSAFTTMRAHKGKVFRLGAHIARVLATAELLSMPHRPPAEDLAAATAEVLDANDLQDARCRMTLTAGGADAPPSVFVTAEPMPPRPRHWDEPGIVAVISSFHQEPGHLMFGYKTGCYAERVLSVREAAAKGAEEAVWFTRDGRLAEGGFCNVFAVVDGVVRTPPRDTPVLPGIARQAVLELCGELGIESDAESPVTGREVLDAEELFLTASTSGIRPVRQLEQHVYGDGAPGKITRWLVEGWAKLLDRECGR